MTYEVDRHWYVKELRSLCLSIATSHGAASPKITVVNSYGDNGDPVVSASEIVCPYLRPGLCSTPDNHGVEAVVIAKIWWCMVVANMPYARAAEAVGVMSMGTSYD